MFMNNDMIKYIVHVCVQCHILLKPRGYTKVRIDSCYCLSVLIEKKEERIKPSTKFLWAEIARGFSSGSEAYECGRVYYLCLGSENKTVARKVGGAG